MLSLIGLLTESDSSSDESSSDEDLSGDFS